jgi:hypothetical protein
MEILNHKFFRAIVFVLLINFENIIVNQFPSLITILIQFISIIIFNYYFLPISIQKSKGKNFILIKYKFLLLIFVIFILNLEHIFILKSLEVKNLIFSIIFAIIFIYFLLPIWFKNDNIVK